MEFTPGILRAFVHPSHFDSLSFCLQPVMAKMAVTFLAGECVATNSGVSQDGMCTSGTRCFDGFASNIPLKEK
ncbi:L-ectoine synthase (N-acetyldiaminobutyrate dehydratase) [Durusdinium trenchii]|uniref:L-ectoine synthase (N-acetyldiaminobutyrate dehydratase) n=1 Tax=Durusdinium trenchii TaxID=1381693 RepID=A0ABP0SSK4_9DINO